MKKKKCRTDCIYFPVEDVNNIRYFYDEHGVKHREDSKCYTCLYSDKKIKCGNKCSHYTPYKNKNGAVI